MAMAKKQLMRLRTHEGEEGVGYLELLAYPTDGSRPNISRTIDVHNLVANHYGPSLLLELDKDGRAIGIEIIYPSQDLG